MASGTARLLLIPLVAAACAAEPPITDEMSAEVRGVGPSSQARVQLVSGQLTAPSRAPAEAIVRDYLAGLEDVRQAPSPLLAAEMVLVRLACVAELPPPADLPRLLAGVTDEPGGAAAPTPARAPT